MKSTKKAHEMTVSELAAYIDHSVLKPEFTQAEIEQCILDGIRYGCRTVCINPSAIPLAQKLCAAERRPTCASCAISPSDSLLLIQKPLRLSLSAAREISSNWML
jgi:deoxyribose-phosphate aldolase